MGLTGVLISLVALTILLAGVFLVRPSITAGATGKILAFLGLCVLPVVSIGMGMSFHIQRSKRTAYCVSCHSMESHGNSLYVLNTNYIPAQHFQNHLVPHDNACYACHTDYTMYGSVRDKIKGLRYLYLEYVSRPPKTIHLNGKYSNLQCLHCHEGMRRFDENPSHTAIMGSLKTNRISCISCHNTIHNASEVARLKMWIPGDAPTSVAAGAAPATAEPAATTGSPIAPARTSASDATSAQGKSIFDSQGCGGCHGEGGVGGTGPALTRTSSQYSPAQLMAVLKAPPAKMKAAGMVPVTVNAAGMKALVAYVSGLGGASAASPTARAPAPPVNVKPGAQASPLKGQIISAASESTSTAAGVTPTAPSGAASRGKTLFDSTGCGGCHGADGVGGVGQALTQISATFQPSQLTALLKVPNAKMKAGGMVPLTLTAADMTALVAYVNSLGGTRVASATAVPASEPAQPNPQPQSGAAHSATAGQPANPSAEGGEAIYVAQGCVACHGPGGSGTARAAALTKLSKTITPEALTSLLQNPNPQMQSGGMTPSKLVATEMRALVAYLQKLGSAGAVTEASQGQYTENKTDVRVHTASYPAAMQEGYRIFAVKCAQCHGLDESWKAGTSSNQAVAEVNRMQAMASSQINNEQAKAIVEFLNYDREHRSH